MELAVLESEGEGEMQKSSKFIHCSKYEKSLNWFEFLVFFLVYEISYDRSRIKKEKKVNKTKNH